MPVAFHVLCSLANKTYVVEILNQTCGTNKLLYTYMHRGGSIYINLLLYVNFYSCSHITYPLRPSAERRENETGEW